MVNLVIGTAALVLSGGVYGQEATGGKDKQKTSASEAAPAQPKTGQPDKTAIPSLEEMLTRALKDNPDIRVAEAKVREADAELNRTRLLVTQKVIAFHRSLEAQKAVVDLAEKEIKQLQDLAPQDAQGFARVKSELTDRQTKLTVAKAKLAEVEAEMPYLLGRQPQSAKSHLDVNSTYSFLSGAQLPATRYDTFWMMANQPINMNLYRDTSGMLYQQLNWFDPNNIVNSQAVQYLAAATATPPAPGSMADKIRKALETPVTFKVAQQPLSDVLAAIEKAAPDVSFRVVDLKDRPIASLQVSNFRVQDLPVVAVLQGLEDTFPGLVFVVREYGILVTWSERLPPGAARVEAFWKAGKEKPKPAEDAARKNPPLEDVRGTILEVDSKSGLVTISLGQDAGLQVGNTLEVYRLAPKPEYLGTIRVLDVGPKAAVGKPVTPEAGKKLQKGDRVASRVNGR
jgi:hypothetical protein